jgi:hypothetical protein
VNPPLPLASDLSEGPSSHPCVAAVSDLLFIAIFMPALLCTRRFSKPVRRPILCSVDGGIVRQAPHHLVSPAEGLSPVGVNPSPFAASLLPFALARL